MLERRQRLRQHDRQQPDGDHASDRDFAHWYASASPGPGHPCTTTAGTPPIFDTNGVRDNGVPGVFNLTPASSYTCRTTDGELSWDAPTKHLTVRGTIFIDGSATIANSGVSEYNGQATLYLSGTLSMSKSSTLCGGIAAGTCDFASWNPNTELLAIVANGEGGDVHAGDGVEFRNSTRFQGAL